MPTLDQTFLDKIAHERNLACALEATALAVIRPADLGCGPEPIGEALIRSAKAYGLSLGALVERWVALGGKI